MAGALAPTVRIAGRLIMMLVDGPAAPHRDTVPEFALDVVLRPGVVTTVIVLGIGAVAAAPLLIVRRMDLPGTPRLAE